jgi:transposase
MTRRRYELTDKVFHHRAIAAQQAAWVPRVDDCRVLNGILWRYRSGAPWAEVRERYGPSTTCYNRFIPWRKAGVLGLIVGGGFRRIQR